MTAVGAIAGAAVPQARLAAAPAAGTARDDAAFAAALARATGGSAAGSAPTPTPATAAPGLAGRVLLDTALRHLGSARASHGGDAGGAGFVAEVHRRLGVTVPADVAGQSAIGVPVPSLAEARSGDLVVLGDPQRVGLYAGGGRIVHAPADGGPVQLSVIEGPVTAIRRVVADTPTVPTAATAATSTADALSRLAAPANAPVPAAAAGAGGVGGTGLAGVPFADLFQRAGAAHGLDPALLAAVARTESAFDPSATSPAGAQGLMQFMPATAAGMGVDPWDPASAVDGAARYLRQGLDRFGTVELALAAYNAGPGAVARHGGIPPYPETQAYVHKVLDAKEMYQR